MRNHERLFPLCDNLATLVIIVASALIEAQREIHKLSSRPCTLGYALWMAENTVSVGVLYEISAPAYGGCTSHGISDIVLSGAPGCSAISYCEQDCKCNGDGVHQ